MQSTTSQIAVVGISARLVSSWLYLDAIVTYNVFWLKNSILWDLMMFSRNDL